LRLAVEKIDLSMLNFNTNPRLTIKIVMDNSKFPAFEVAYLVDGHYMYVIHSEVVFKHM